MEEQSNRNYFLLDKNYLLKQVQVDNKQAFLQHLVQTVKNDYLTYCNPLGLIDDTVLTIQNYKDFNVDHLQEFYDLLSGIYRYQIGTNQLEFLFDGKSHFEKYQEDWQSCFESWVAEFCKDERFLKSVLAVTVFFKNKYSAAMVESRLKSFVSNYFSIKVYRHKGIISADVA